jgi:hypothetical protein
LLRVPSLDLLEAPPLAIKLITFLHHGRDVSDIIGASSAPRNIETSISDVIVRLDWDPPLNNGGVVITNYLISVNMSQQLFIADTTTIFTLNSTGQLLVAVSAVNECGFVSDNATTTINTTGPGSLSYQLLG